MFSFKSVLFYITGTTSIVIPMQARYYQESSHTPMLNHLDSDLHPE